MIKALLMELGYTEDVITQMLNEHSFKCYTSETLLKRIKTNHHFLLSMDYSDEDIIKMVKQQFSVYTLSTENI